MQLDYWKLAFVLYISRVRGTLGIRQCASMLNAVGLQGMR